ncbi:MAG: hypothetical protein SPL02_00045 [Bacilli bacterium]|nr:hypothetical protein [Bacilli bacterium]MDY6430559.1 hypothetical protein [Bacilli bacterium]
MLKSKVLVVLSSIALLAACGGGGSNGGGGGLVTGSVESMKPQDVSVESEKKSEVKGSYKKAVSTVSASGTSPSYSGMVSVNSNESVTFDVENGVYSMSSTDNSAVSGVAYQIASNASIKKEGQNWAFNQNKKVTTAAGYSSESILFDSIESAYRSFEGYRECLYSWNINNLIQLTANRFQALGANISAYSEQVFQSSFVVSGNKENGTFSCGLAEAKEIQDGQAKVKFTQMRFDYVDFLLSNLSLSVTIEVNGQTGSITGNQSVAYVK